MLDITADRLALEYFDPNLRNTRNRRQQAQFAENLINETISLDDTSDLVLFTHTIRPELLASTQGTSSTVSTPWVSVSTSVTTTTSSSSTNSWTTMHNVDQKTLRDWARWNKFATTERVPFEYWTNDATSIPGGNYDLDRYTLEEISGNNCVRCGDPLSVINRSLGDPLMCEHCAHEINNSVVTLSRSDDLIIRLNQELHPEIEELGWFTIPLTAV